MRNPFFAVGLVMIGLVACGGGSGIAAKPDGAAQPGVDAPSVSSDTGTGGSAGIAGSSAGGTGGAGDSDARVASGGAVDVPAATGGAATDGPIASGGTAAPDAQAATGGRLDAGGAGTGGTSGSVDADDNFLAGSLNFTATPPVIAPGQSSTLSWASHTASSLSIDQGIGSVLGKTSVVVTPGQTTTYILNLDNLLRDKVTVTVTTAGFTGTGAMVAATTKHTATLLANGKVLIAGGSDAKFGLASARAELYDPGTGTFSATGSMGMARTSHTATLLPNGKVLLVGGAGTSAELYDPTTGTFADTGKPTSAKIEHTATLLPGGTVLIAGGGGTGSALASAELYDPATGTFAATGNLTVPRTKHAAVLLSNGTVLLVGGAESANALNQLFGLTSAELYDPKTGLFTATGSLTEKRAVPRAMLLPSGKVLVVGGQINFDGVVASRSLEIYDPVTGTFATTGGLLQERNYFTATVLPSGMVLFAGGYQGGGAYANYFASAELYDPGTGKCTATGAMAARRELHSATLLPSGKVLVAGGDTGAALASAELYQQ